MKTNRSFAHGGEIPVAMSRVMAQNTTAALNFSAMNSQSRQALIDGAFTRAAFANMQAYIDCFDGSSDNISYPDSMMLN